MTGRVSNIRESYLAALVALAANTTSLRNFLLVFGFESEVDKSLAGLFSLTSELSSCSSKFRLPLCDLPSLSGLLGLCSSCRVCGLCDSSDWCGLCGLFAELLLEPLGEPAGELAWLRFRLSAFIGILDFR